MTTVFNKRFHAVDITGKSYLCDKFVVVFDTCWNYPEGTVYDTNWKSAKAFNTMSLTIGGIVAFVTLFAACMKPSKKIFQIAVMFNMVCCLFTGLLLLLLNSNACNNNLNVATFELAFPLLDLTFPDTCTMGVGAKTLAGFSCCYNPQAPTTLQSPIG